jgi:isopentenyl diphosphate isomerase/L-lactate dehydrogenase-like FMN-dependent dehydrogenase
MATVVNVVRLRVNEFGAFHPIPRFIGPVGVTVIASEEGETRAKSKETSL